MNATRSLQQSAPWLFMAMLAALVLSITACSRATSDAPDETEYAPELASVVTPPALLEPSPAPASQQRAPLFAYYYIWFDSQSWNRAKIDYPQLGRYSSDDEGVMRQHIAWAKEAGIDGFIVGWKSTPKLNARLEKILRIADEEAFKIILIYQALDFSRDPLTINRIGADLDEFIAQHSRHPSLQVFSKPVVIWSGTWKFSARQVESVTAQRREKLLILATAKSVKDYLRIAHLVDGNAYYWSSVNVDTNASHATKLNEMADAIHSRNGLWIAPAAPGFDARLVGGKQVIDRNDGETLRRQLAAAAAASPDAIGLISWNEFSENSHVEPSAAHGRRYLDVLREIRQTR